MAVDGDGGDWHDFGARFTVARPVVEAAATARADVRLAWDRTQLWALFEVTDPTFHPPPSAAAGPELFQWDSVEIYVDSQGDRSERMGADDFQVLLAPDGRFVVLEGDPLLLEFEELSVPKRERPAIVVTAAGRHREGGYTVECSIPWAALGVVPGAGRPLALDLALNDWLGDHPAARQVDYNLETVRKLDHSPSGPRAFTPFGLEAESAAALEQRLYRPWSLGGTGDFGHPRNFLPVGFTGGPGLADRFVEELGAGGTLAGGAATTLLLGVALYALEERRHRRRIAALLARLGELEAATATADGPAAQEPAAQPPAATAPSPPAPPDPLDWLERAAERTASSSASERLEQRAVRAIRDRLDEALSPALLAAALFVSLRTLQRHLTGSLRCSPGELILAVKMREAKRLLETGGLQVQQVARRVGYDDPAHFSRRFKAYFGLAPAALAGSTRRPEHESSVA